MRASLRVFVLLAASCIASAACGSAGNDDVAGAAADSTANAGLDVDDVSFLFPLRKVGAGPLDFDLYPKIGVDRAMFDEAFIHQILDFGSDRGVEFFYDGLAKWRVTALRYDPCAPGVDANAPCVQQVRLVTQPVRDVPGAGVDDIGMHLLFRVGTGAPTRSDPVIAELRAIQAASRQAGAETVGRTLGEHPGLAKEAARRAGPVGDKVKAFVAAHAKLASLEEITFTGTSRGDDSWFFYGGPVTNGTWKPSKVPNVATRAATQSDPGEDALSIGLLGIGDEQALAPAPAASFVSAAPVLNVAVDHARPADLAALHHIDNPLEATTRNTDCGSCHASSRLLRVRKVPFTGRGGEYENPVGLTGFAELGLQPPDETNVRNFGWLFQQPTVTWLTANSSAAVAARINASQGWRNPSARDCRAPAIRECFAGRGANGATTHGTASECLALCAGTP